MLSAGTGEDVLSSGSVEDGVGVVSGWPRGPWWIVEICFDRGFVVMDGRVVADAEESVSVLVMDAEGVPAVPGRTSLGIEGGGRRSSV